MPQENTPKFQPGLMIFVGKVGEQIREYLSPYYYGPHQRWLQDPPTPSPYHLLAYLAQPLCDCIALLQVVTEGPYAEPDQAIAFPVMKTFPANDKDIPTGSGPLAEMINKALDSIMLARRIDAIDQHNYDTAHSRAQVFIIGEPNAQNKPRMAQILKLIRKYERHSRFELVVSYVLNCYDTTTDYAASLKKPSSVASLSWSAYEVANFTYVYERTTLHPQFFVFTEDEVRYATAEALLAFVTSGVTTSQMFKDVSIATPLLETYEDRVGSFSTIMIRFPRAAIHRYCAAHLTRDMLQKWLQDFNHSTLSLAQCEKEEQDASNLANDLKSWMGDGQSHIDDEQYSGTAITLLQSDNLSEAALPNSVLREADPLQRKTEYLFNLLAPATIAEDYDASQTSSWVAFLTWRSGDARHAYIGWQEAAESAWKTINRVINDRIKHEIDNRWAHDTQGFAAATVFVKVLDEHLDALEQKTHEWKRIHEDIYRRKLTNFATLAGGEWVVMSHQQSLRITNQNGRSIGQARPTMGNIDVRANAPTVGGHVMLPQMQPMEARISRNLLARTNWKQQQVPSIAALGSVGTISWLGGTFSLIAFGLPSLSLVSVALAAFIAVANLSFYLMRRGEREKARAVVAEFYRCYYTHLCEQFEDEQRMALINTLRERVRRIRQRLDNFNVFFDERKNKAQETMQEASDTLFKGPAASHDVFVANGEQLHEQGTHTLESVAGSIDRKRQSNQDSLKNWHRTFESLKEELVKHLQQDAKTTSRSLLEMGEQELQEYLYSFCGEIIEGYLTGTLVDISAALDKTEIWRSVLERRRRSPYNTDVGNREPRMTFVGGSAKALQEGKLHVPSEAFRQVTLNDEWLLVGGLFRGGNPRVVDGNALFPIK